MHIDARSSHDTSLFHGRDLSARGRHDDALRWFDLALAERPSVAALSAKGDALFALGRVRESLVAFETAIERSGEAAYPYYGKGRALTKLGSHHEAIEPLRRFLALSPSPSRLTAQVSAWLDAMTRVGDVPSIPPPSDPLERARALRGAGKPRQALATLDEETSSPRAEVWLERARCQEDLGRADLAHDAVMEAIIRDEGDPEAWLLRARFEIALGKHLDARRAIQRLVRMRPRVAAYLTVAARLFASIGDLHAARKHAVDALSTDPGIVEAWLVKARSDLALGDARAAIPALRMVQQLAPSDDFGTQHEAQALLRKATAG